MIEGDLGKHDVRARNETLREILERMSGQNRELATAEFEAIGPSLDHQSLYRAIYATIRAQLAMGETIDGISADSLGFSRDDELAQQAFADALVDFKAGIAPRF